MTKRDLIAKLDRITDDAEVWISLDDDLFSKKFPIRDVEHLQQTKPNRAECVLYPDLSI